MRKLRAAFVVTTALAMSSFTMVPAQAITCGELDTACAVVAEACQKVTKRPCFY